MSEPASPVRKCLVKFECNEELHLATWRLKIQKPRRVTKNDTQRVSFFVKTLWYLLRILRYILNYMPTQKSFLRTMFSGKLGRTFLILYVMPILIIILTFAIWYLAGCTGGFVTPFKCSFSLLNSFGSESMSLVFISGVWLTYTSPFGLILLLILFVRGIRQYRINRNTSANSLQ